MVTRQAKNNVIESIWQYGWSHLLKTIYLHIKKILKDTQPEANKLFLEKYVTRF